jgi:hypothetical protein
MLCREFQALSEKSAESFRAKAEDMDIPFVHIVKFSERERAVEDVMREYGSVEFVISDTEEERASQNANRIEERERARQPIYVYTVL